MAGQVTEGNTNSIIITIVSDVPLVVSLVYPEAIEGNMAG